MKVRCGPCGLHLHEPRTGLNLLFDEVSLPREKWSEAPRHVSIAVTDACDLDCPFCYVPKSDNRLDPCVLQGWLRELDDNGCLGVGFGGGEPTLYEPLPDLCEFAATRTGLTVTLTTHGHNLSQALLERLAGSVDFLRVSVDGVGRRYESIRRRSFAELQQRLAWVRELIPFGINFVVNAATLQDLTPIAELAADIGASELLLLPEQRGRLSVGIDQETARALRSWVRQFPGPVRLAVSESGAEGLPTCDPLPRETGLRAFGHIDASGSAKATSFHSAGIPIGQAGVIAAFRALNVSLEDENEALV